MLVLDDLHWADWGRSSCSERAAPAAVGARSGRARRPAAPVARATLGARSSAPRGGSLTRIEIGGLERRGRAPARRRGRGGVAAALFDESGGNPFYLQQLARALARARRCRPQASSRSRVSRCRAVAAALADELALLSDDARPVFEGAAVAGDPFVPELAAAAAAMPERRRSTGWTSCWRSTSSARPTCRAASASAIRSCVRPSTRRRPAAGGSARRTRAAELASSGAAAPPRPPCGASARHGDQAAIAALQEAGEAAAQRTPAGAARWFGAALRLLPAAAPVISGSACYARARALAATGEFADAHAALVESLRRAHRGVGPARRSGRRVRRGSSTSSAATTTRARAWWPRSTPSGPPLGEAAALMIDLGVGAFYRMDHDAAQRGPIARSRSRARSAPHLRRRRRARRAHARVRRRGARQSPRLDAGGPSWP